MEPAPPKTHLAVLLLTLLVIVSPFMGGIIVSAQTPLASPVTASAYDPDDLLAIKPGLREEIAAALPPGMTVYDIALTFPEDTSDRTLEGSQEIVYTNTTGEVLNALPFRLYANSADPENNAVTIDEVSVGGAEVSVELSVDNSVAMVALPAPLAPGEEARIDMGFTTHVPQDEKLHYGIFNHASDTGTWSLAHWYPVVAGRDRETGWMLEPTSEYGDPIFTETGLYTVTVTAPENLTFITSGVEIGSEAAGGIATTTFNASPSRDFVMFADADMKSVAREVSGTTVTSWYEPGHGEAGKAALTWSAQALRLFNNLLGEYPYRQLQLSEIEIYNAAGVEFPQLIALSRGYYQTEPRLESPGYFEFTVAHEVVHEWFYNLVGNNQYAHAFIDEGLTNYLSARVYFEEFYGEQEADQVVRDFLVRPFRNAVVSGVDPVVDFPTDEFPSQQDYVVAAYSKGALGFSAIHEAIGDDAFFDALQVYVQDFRFRVATPEDLLAVFKAVSNIPIEPIWNYWFKERNGDLDAIG
ncbi:MAG TPA: M1 family metallopeptidase [Thermomicrobiales bacterium]|nr:M1 family metallopeptidase [Thermomicrobiales bacterium]